MFISTHIAVGQTVRDPFPHWADIMCGITAIANAMGLGMIRVAYTSEECYQDYIPADHVISAMLVATWKKHIE